ncbi:hypothetical protein EWM63_01925 [Pseudoduganella lutea]|uniref:Glycosyl hydrolases family 39 N-terminal catalytic domain-containing protein n=1 Tax=Pseudoduganella lutea TaxID=321985 RepID=A0A4P6L5Q3_9BURK|nr:hypothetical protein EWM63_01925 [Pseudoduganella lutea]
MLTLAAAGALLPAVAVAQQAAPPLTHIGDVAPRPAHAGTRNNWLLGCETLDRDFASYDAYKDYLVPLGIRRLRLQAGWAKTEKKPGEYDWAWLDHIVDDATSRGLAPWLQLAYGNAIYPGGGGTNLAAGVPDSPQALAAWDRWVTALVTRYRDRVTDWEVWNEPNFGDNTYNTPESFAALSARSAAIIRRLQPKAKISGLALGHIDYDYAERFFQALHAKRQLALFDNITYHDYVYNPDQHYPKVEKLRAILHKYAPGMPLRQGENGAPSVPYSGGALGDWAWSEIAQAKWATRRMLGDLGHDIESSVFTIIEIAYTNGPINTLNTKGLIKSDASKRALRPKAAYRAVQTVVAIFDDQLARLPDIGHVHNDKLVPQDPRKVLMTASTDRTVAAYGYRHKASGKDAYTLWLADVIPGSDLARKSYRIGLANARFEQPVYVDVISGKVYDIPASEWHVKDGRTVFTNIPLFDGPVVIADKSLVPLAAASPAG